MVFRYLSAWLAFTLALTGGLLLHFNKKIYFSWDVAHQPFLKG